MQRTNEATDTDLKVIERLTQQLGWKRGDTLLYQQEYVLSPEHQKMFDGRKSIKPDITLTDLSGNIVAVFENKFEDEKKALTKLRTLYAAILKPRFLYACSPERILFYDTAWKGLDSGEFRPVSDFMTLEDMLLMIEQEKNKNFDRAIIIDKSIAGGFNQSCGKEMYFQIDCIESLLNKYREGKQKMLIHMATGLGKTRVMVAFVKALLQHNMARRVLFVVDRIMLAEQALNDGFHLISNEFSAVRITSGNVRQHKHAGIHIVVIDTLENIYQDMPASFYDLLIVDECHRSININRKLIFDHFLCPRIGLTATPRKAIAKEGKNISEEDLAILDTYKLFGCETGEPDYQFDLSRGIEEGFLAPYSVLSIETELTKLAKTSGVEFNYVLDPDTRAKIELDETKKLMLEQLNRRYIAEELCLRVAEEIRKNTEYGEKVILFGASQAHCTMLAKAVNKVFKTPEDELSPRYAEAIISENNDLNLTLKKWFKDPKRKPYVAVSVDIMGTGVDIPCVRYIAFCVLTKSIGKYIQMLGRGTRLDPKSGKFSFKVLDFTGLCKNMEDNGQGTQRPNIKEVRGTEGGGDGGEPPTTGSGAGIIDNPDPEHLIQRVWLHGDKIRVIDNIPIDKAMEIFENELERAEKAEIIDIKNKAKENPEYQPQDDELDILRDWVKNPEVYLDEGQLQKIYDFRQGSIWDFMLHALKIKSIPTPVQRIEKGFESYLKTYPFTDEQIRILHKFRKYFIANIQKRESVEAEKIFDNPVRVKLFGGDYNELNKKFNGKLKTVVNDLQSSLRI